MKISVISGDVRVAEVEVHRHQGFFSVAILTPEDPCPYVILSSTMEKDRCYRGVLLFPAPDRTARTPTKVRLIVETNEEEECFMWGLHDVTDSKRVVSLIAISPDTYEDLETVASWEEPSGPIDYLTPA